MPYRNNPDSLRWSLAPRAPRIGATPSSALRRLSIRAPRARRRQKHHHLTPNQLPNQLQTPPSGSVLPRHRPSPLRLPSPFRVVAVRPRPLVSKPNLPSTRETIPTTTIPATTTTRKNYVDYQSFPPSPRRLTATFSSTRGPIKIPNKQTNKRSGGRAQSKQKMNE